MHSLAEQPRSGQAPVWLEKIIPSVRLRACTDTRVSDVRGREILCCSSVCTPVFLVVISQGQLLLNLLLGTIQHIYTGDFVWNWRENMILVYFTPPWIKGWMNFLSSPAAVSGNVVLFLVILHQSCSEEMLWLTRSSSLAA